MKTYKFDSSQTISSSVSMLFIVVLALWFALFAFRESRKMIAEMKNLSEQHMIIYDQLSHPSAKTLK